MSNRFLPAALCGFLLIPALCAADCSQLDSLASTVASLQGQCAGAQASVQSLVAQRDAKLLQINNKLKKTKAKKKSYITGLHGSGAAKMKAEFRKKRANRHKNK